MGERAGSGRNDNRREPRYGLPTYCYDGIRPHLMSNDEAARRGAARIDALIRAHAKEQRDG